MSKQQDCKRDDGGQVRPRPLSWAAGIAALSLLLAAPVAAQTASQLAPKTFVPPPAPPPRLPEPAAAATPPEPAEADDLFVTLAGVTIDGGLPPMAATEAALATDLAGKRLSGREILAAAQTLEHAYARAGFVLARVVVPPQHLDDGARLKLVVIDGFIERIAVTAPRARLRGLLERRLAALQGVRGLTLHTIERRIELAADLPGVTVRSALSPGIARGATVLVIDAGFHRVDGSLSLDNALAAALGGIQLGFGVNVHDLAGIGDELYIRASGFPGGGGAFARFARNRAVAAGAVIPIGADGVTFNAEGLTARTTPSSPVDLRFTDRFDRTSLRLRYPWLRSRALTVAANAALDIEDESQSALFADSVLPLSQDRMRVVRLGVEVARIDMRHGTLSASLTLSRGFDALGARTAADASVLLPLSRQRADATFTKLDAAFGYAGAITRQLTLTVAARAQTAFGAALLHAEQFGIAGRGALSAFDSGSLQGDAGAVGRADIAAPLPLTVHRHAIVAAPYVFGSAGIVSLAAPTAAETRILRAAAFGAGVTFGGGAAGPIAGETFSFEYARQERSDGAPATGRVTVTTSIRF